MRKFLTVAALTGALLATGASGAFASGVPAAHGEGKTPLSASRGVVSQSPTQRTARMPKFLTGAARTGARLATGASGAFASGVTQANGQGQTPLSASLVFNAKSNLTGSLNYNADPSGPNSGFSAHCNDYFFYAIPTPKPASPRAK